MPNLPRVETPGIINLLTTKTRNSELWLVNNPKLDERILAYLAKYATEYQVIVYAFVIQGNHYHLVADFPRGNRADFFQSFNSIVAKLVKRYVPTYPGGSLWRRPYVEQALPLYCDAEDKFFYCALQPVSSGLAEKISDYPSYNGFSDAVIGSTRWFKIVDWARYNDKRRYNKDVDIEEFTKWYQLTYQRLPGYEHLSMREYSNYMHDQLEKRRVLLVNAKKAKGESYPPPEVLLLTKPGDIPRSTKTSTRYSYHPRVLSRSLEARQAYLDFYFSVVRAYKEASRRYRNGELDVVFPPGTYKPHIKVPAVPLA